MRTKLFHSWLWMDLSLRYLLLWPALHCLPFRQVVTFLAGLRGGSYRALHSDTRRWAFIWALRWTRVTRQNPCLRAALLMFWLDQEARLVIGAHGDFESPGFHAWVESEGETYSAIRTEALSPLWSMKHAP